MEFKLSFSDRIFIGVSVMIFIGLLWLKFLEDKLSMWYALIISLAIIFVILRIGKRPLNTRS